MHVWITPEIPEDVPPFQKPSIPYAVSAEVVISSVECDMQLVGRYAADPSQTIVSVRGPEYIEHPAERLMQLPALRPCIARLSAAYAAWAAGRCSITGADFDLAQAMQLLTVHEGLDSGQSLLNTAARRTWRSTATRAGSTPLA